MKAFIAEGTGAAQQLSGIQDEKIPIYGSKAAAEADIENLEENQIVATKENGFSSDGVYIASSSAITGGDLIANSSMKIMFTSDIVGENTSTPLSISWNGESYLVKVANNSQLQNIYAHEVSSGVFKYVQAYTTLELIFDGVQFVIVGNPLVLSSSTYSIYANGHFELLKITTDEQWTGRYWKNGKKIYTKIVESPSQGTTIATSVDEVISYVAKRRWSANDSRSVFYDGNSGYNSIVIDETSGNVSFAKSEASYNSTIHFIILEYTKTTD